MRVGLGGITGTRILSVGPGVSVGGGGGGGVPQAYYVEYNGTTSMINVGNDASINDLATGAFTVEAWVRADGWGESATGRIVNKISGSAGWNLFMNLSNGLGAYIFCDGADAIAYSGTDEFAADGEWRHAAMTWDDATYQHPRLWIGGSEVASYANVSSRGGAISGSDAALDLIIGNSSAGDRTVDGAIGWLRVSNMVRYTEAFTPSPRCSPPQTDANTVLLLRMLEGNGNPQDSSGNGNHGTLTDGVWYTCDGVAVEASGTFTYASSIEE